MPTAIISLGDHIKKKRLELHLLQRDVAKLIGVSTDAVTFWENHRSQPLVQYYPTIIKFLGYYPFDHDSESVADIIREVRFRNGWTCQQLGERLHVNGSTIGAWETSRHLPSIGRIKKIVSTLQQFAKKQHLSY